MPSAEDMPQPPKPSLPRISLSGTMQALGIVGVLGYALLMTAYDRYYAALGLRPEEAGIDKTAIIARTLGALPYFSPVVFAITLAFGITLALKINKREVQETHAVLDGLEAEAKRVGSRLRASDREARISPLHAQMETRRKEINHSRLVSLWLAAGGYLFCFVLGVSTAIHHANALADIIDLKVYQTMLGGRTQPVESLGLTMLDLKSEPVDVQWVGDPEQRPAFLSPTVPQQFSYIGQRDGIVVLFAFPGKTVRVPANNVAITFLCARPKDHPHQSGRCAGHSGDPTNLPTGATPEPSATP